MYICIYMCIYTHTCKHEQMRICQRGLDSPKIAEENQGAWIKWVESGLEIGQFTKLWWSHPTECCPFFASCINAAFSYIFNFDSLSHFSFLSLCSANDSSANPPVVKSIWKLSPSYFISPSKWFLQSLLQKEWIWTQRQNIWANERSKKIILEVFSLTHVILCTLQEGECPFK